MKGPIQSVFDTEKTAVSAVVSSSDGESVNWTPEEERRAVRKADFVIMPLLMFSFFTLQLDRSNAGNALTDNFLEDIGITQNEFNIGIQLLYAGIIMLEIPSNMVLYRIGPKAWLSGQIFAFGLVAILQSFQKGLPAYLSTRLLLGLTETGFVPGGLYTLSLWYKGSELSTRFALYFLGNGLATASGGLLAYSILQLRGVAGLAGWQWLFILEGLMTIVAGILFLCLFPGTPSNPVSLIGVHFFTEREQMILHKRILVDDPSKVTTKSIKGRDILSTLGNIRLWPHLLLTAVGLAPSNALWSYAPSIVRSFGYDRLASNALTSIGQWMAVVLLIFLGWLADLWGRRGFLVFGAVSVQFVFTVAYKSLPNDSGAGIRFGMLTMAAGTTSWWHALNGSWLSINARSSADRSMRMACFIMSANVAGIVGGQLFRQDDLPFYHRGWAIAVAFVAFATACVIFLILTYAWSNKKIKHTGTRTGVRSSDSEELQLRLYNY